MKIKKIVLGLGNPEGEYAFTPHNAGKMTVKYYVESIESELTWSKIDRFGVQNVIIGDNLIVIIDTYMNLTGEVLDRFMNYYKIRDLDLLLLFDDLDIDLGKYKVGNKFPKGHNGVNSVLQNRSRFRDINSIRIGIYDSENPLCTYNPIDYVISKLTQEKFKILEATIAQIAKSEIDKFINVHGKSLDITGKEDCL